MGKTVAPKTAADYFKARPVISKSFLEGGIKEYTYVKKKKAKR